MTITLNGTTGIVSPKVNALDLELDSKNVVERGSNANGEYVRFADGTQICTAPNGIQCSNAEHVLWTFPAAFSNTNYVGAGLPGMSAATSIAPVFANRLTTSVAVAALTSANARSVQNVFLLMIGRWY